ncbi:replicative DNA helicase [Endothiovibrio diazotrophicus]
MNRPFPGGGHVDEATEALRVPPHSIQAEQAVLGGLMIANETWDSVSDRVSEGDFYRLEHRLIFRAITELAQQSSPFDAVTVHERLSKTAELDSAGGSSYLGTLSQSTPSAANIAAYADIVRERSVLRQLIQVGTEVANSGYVTEGRPITELLDDAERKVFEIAEQSARFSRGGARGMKEVLKNVVEKIDELFNSDSHITGVTTGFNDFDEKTAGLQPADLVIVAGRPSMGKCVEASTEIVLEDGSVETIETLYRRRRARLLTLANDWRLHVTEPSAFVDDGEKPVFRLTTRLGRAIETTATHPYLTPRGWRPLDELSIGERVAVPRALPLFGDEAMRDCEVKLLGYLLGDGCLTLTRGAPKFTNVDTRMQADFMAAVAEFGGVRATLKRRSGRAPDISIAADGQDVARHRERFAAGLRGALEAAGLSGRQFALAVDVSPASVWNWTHSRSMPGAELFSRVAAFFQQERVGEWVPEGRECAAASSRNAVTRWLEGLGVWGKDAHGKFIPAPVFRLPRSLMALFINRLFATDGWATLLSSGRGQLGFSTVSERMGRQLQHLLLRFGVIAKLRSRQVKLGERRHRAWQLDITDPASIMTFAAEIGIFGKEEAVERVVRAVAGKRRQTNRDLIPLEFWEDLARAKGDEPWSHLARRAGLEGSSNIHVGRRALSRDRLARLAAALDDQRLGDLAASDVYWDEVAAIDYLGRKRVYDLTIPETHNFVANDLCVHNTTFAMNMAENAAMKAGKSVAVFSMEMPAESLVMRMLSSLGRIDQHRLRVGDLTDDDWPRITSTVQILSEAKIFIDDTPALSPTEMRSRARRIAREHGLDMIVVDYLQLMQVPGMKENRTAEISEISRGLKGLAKELNVPVIALSQLNRSLEQRPNKRPVMSDLRESGAIEQDADVIVFIYRDEVYNPDTPEKGKAEIIIGKQRNGPIGTVNLTFLGKHTRFENYIPEIYGGEEY